MMFDKRLLILLDQRASPEFNRVDRPQMALPGTAAKERKAKDPP